MSPPKKKNPKKPSNKNAESSKQRGTSSAARRGLVAETGIKYPPIAIEISSLSSSAKKKFAKSLEKYLDNLERLVSESSRSHRFAMFFQEIFGVETELIAKYTTGIEKSLRVKNDDQILRGRADNLFGNLIIEFESKIPDKLNEAIEQLRRYVAIIWSTEQLNERTPFLALATDGARFYMYSATADQTKAFLSPDDVELTEVDYVDWTSLNADDVWMWVDRYFWREEPMIPQTNTIVRDFGIGSHAFKTITNVLMSRWQSCKSKSSFDVVYDSWEKYLRIVYGETVGADELFIRHTYLATFAKLLSWVHISESTHSPSLEEINEVISGDYFKKQGIENFIEEDFFSWIVRSEALSDGIKICKWLLSILRKYDLSRLSEDVLKSLYQELVDPQARRYLGEFYTPDWLADKIVSGALQKKPEATVLDPTCGSGSFLYLAVRRKRELLGESQDTLAHVFSSVCGIDIHPLAVIIAKTNFILALGGLLAKRKQSVTIPVYLSDSIRLPEKGQMSVFLQVPGFKVTLEGTEVFLPEEFVEDYNLYDQTIELAREYARQHEKKPIDVTSFKSFLEVSKYPKLSDDQLVRSAFEIAKVLKDFIDNERDSIWSYVLKNIYKPLFLKNKFDYILGNPPWLPYRLMESQYQKSLKEQIVRQYKLYCGKAEMMTAMEVATLFLLRAADLYLKKGGEITFVLPRSIFSAEQHDSLRRKSFKLFENTDQTVDWCEIWDLKDVKPIFRFPCCVLRAEKIDSDPNRKHTPTPTLTFSGRLPNRNLKLSDAQIHLSHRSEQLQTQLIGKRSFWDTNTTTVTNLGRSAYFDKFAEGATIVPRCCWFVTIGATKLGINLKCPAIASEPHAMATAKDAYKGVSIKGTVENQFLYGTMTGSEVIPFGSTGMRVVLLPLLRKNGISKIFESADARSSGFLHLSKWLLQVEKVWSERRGAKAGKMTIYKRINHNNGLTRQKTDAQYRVVYNGAGKNISCAVIEKQKDMSTNINGQDISLSGFIADCKLIYFETDNANEAFYLAAFLNSSEVNKLIKPIQSHGEHNPRDIHKKPFELPIPKFDPKDQTHIRLAKLSRAATDKIRKWSKSTNLSTQSIAKTRAQARSLITSELEEIDSIVKPLLS